MIRMLTELHSSYENLLPKNRIKAFNSVIAILLEASTAQDLYEEFASCVDLGDIDISNFKLFCFLRNTRNIYTQYWHLRALLANTSNETTRFVKCLALVLEEAFYKATQSNISILQAIQLVIYELRQLFDKRNDK